MLGLSTYQRGGGRIMFLCRTGSNRHSILHSKNWSGVSGVNLPRLANSVQACDTHLRDETIEVK